jgi:protein phosphatase
MSTLEIKAAGLTDVGQRRGHNEDAFLVEPELGIYVVADGMGGHAAGEVASRIAVETMQECFASGPEGKRDADTVAQLLEEAVHQANARILEAVQEKPALRGMGTTLIAAFPVDGELLIAHVGDSRAYRVRGGQLQRDTSDHSWVAEQVEQGVLSRADAEKHPFRNIITRALGARDDVEPDLARIPMEAGDRILLCSDGLSTMISDEEILRILLGAATAEEGCRSLVDEANRAGGHDNVTVVLLFVEEP